MRFGLFPVEAGELKQYKLDMQEAFQEGFGNKFGKTILLSAETQSRNTFAVLLEPLRRLVGREESFRLCEMRTQTIGRTSEHRIKSRPPGHLSSSSPRRVWLCLGLPVTLKLCTCVVSQHSIPRQTSVLSGKYV